MGRSRGRKKQGLSDDEKRKYLRFLIIPFIVILLIIVIVVTDRAPKKAENSGSAGVSSQTDSSGQDLSSAQSDGVSPASVESNTETIAPDNKEYVQNFENYGLKKDEVPEVKALIEAYCEAKINCDPEALSAVFGQNLSEEELATERAKLEKTAQVVEGYENIIAYTEDGPKADTYVVYPYYEIKFKDVPTPLPVLTMCYVQKNSEGRYVMTLDFDDAVADYISKVNTTEDVKLLAAQVDAKVQEAVANDPALNGIYNGISSGSPETEETGAEESTQESSEGADGESQSAGAETEPHTEALTEPEIQIDGTTAAQ